MEEDMFGTRGGDLLRHHINRPEQPTAK